MLWGKMGGGILERECDGKWQEDYKNVTSIILSLG